MEISERYLQEIRWNVVSARIHSTVSRAADRALQRGLVYGIILPIEAAEVAKAYFGYSPDPGVTGIAAVVGSIICGPLLGHIESIRNFEKTIAEKSRTFYEIQDIVKKWSENYRGEHL